MTEVEDLLRRTFADRERDLAGAAPALAGVRERSRRRRRRRAAVLAGGVAAVAAILAGSIVALTVGTPRAATGTTPAGPGPAAADLPTYRTVEVTTADGRTRAAIPWVPTWLPAGIGETARLAGSGGQVRFYGRTRSGPSVRIELSQPAVSVPATTPAECSGTSDDPTGTGAVAVTVAGRSARLWPARLRPTPDMWPGATAPAGSGHQVCVPLAGGGALWTTVFGTADTAADAVRVAGSVRAGGPAEVAVPFSLGVPVAGVGVFADDAGTGWWTGQLAAGGTLVQVTRPDPTSPPPNTTLGGRPAHVTSAPTKGTFVTMPLESDLEAKLAGEFREDTLAAATGLRVGPTPDYSWFYR